MQRPAGCLRGWALGQCPGTRFHWPTLLNRDALRQSPALQEPWFSAPGELRQPQWCGQASLSFLSCSPPFPHDLTVGWKRRDSKSAKGDPRPPRAVVKTLPTPAVVDIALGMFPGDGLEFLLRVLLFSLSPVIQEGGPFLPFTYVYK